MPGNDSEDQRVALLAPSPQTLAETLVFPLIHQINLEVEENIDSALTWDQLTASDINFTVVRPLVSKLARPRNLASVYALFVVRAHYLSLCESDLANSGLYSSRAMMCELMAIKLLRRFARNPFELVATLTTSWNPLAGASDQSLADIKGMLKNEDVFQPASALETAISTKSKHFLSSNLVQKVITDVWAGNVVFSTISTRSILADNYKTRQIEFYDCRQAPILNHYRLRVPKYGAILELVNFILLFVTFVFCITYRDLDHVTLEELVFGVFAFAFVLEEYTASQEHGWTIYMANVWNGFDTVFIIIFLVYAGFRAKGLANGDPAASDLAFDILACGACILFPRLAFFAMSNNVIVILRRALQGMIKEFCFFIFLAAICFSGLLFTLWKLANGTWEIRRIAWLMVQIWFGNTTLSFAQAESFHPVFGPILMVVFAALSNTLLITILISILSNTFARIDANATQEYLFQFAVSTMEGVKGDALFSYQPPFNLLAYVILLPLSRIVGPRDLHRINVLLMRITSFPILLVITIYERYFAVGQKWRESSQGAGKSIVASLPRQITQSAIFEAFLGSNSNDLLEAIFSVDIRDEVDASREHVDEGPMLRSYASRETVTINRGSRQDSAPASPADFRPRSRSRQRDPDSGDLEPRTSSSSYASPLAKLFARRPVSEAMASQTSLDNVAMTRKLDVFLDNLKELPVQQLKQEMKELQDRQARIENLLMMLTRGMRGEGPVGANAGSRKG